MSMYIYALVFIVTAKLWCDHCYQCFRSLVHHYAYFLQEKCFFYVPLMLVLLMLGTQENRYLWRTGLYLAASASAEFFADIALCPMEAVKVRIQTQPGFAANLREGLPKLMKEEGYWG